ncbi:MAG TPA: hypothetical protein VFA24_08110 [Gaiellaceae bacterium]|nr:hypothetical protein [Gaiellaceae bacterium]
MGRNALIAVIAAAVVAVAALAVLTPTVIVGDRGREARSVRVVLPEARAPLPLRPGGLRELRRCLQSHGFDRSTRPTVPRLRGALRDCLRPRLR